MTLSIDIESIGEDPSTLDDRLRARLTAHDKAGEESALDRLALSPFTGRVVVIAAWNDVKEMGACLTVGAPEARNALPAFWTHRDYATEAEMLRVFWASCKRHSRFASFNGIGFDLPFLLGRSIACGVAVHRPLYVAKPWEDTHIDLCERLKCGYRGRPSLDIVCHALGAPSPKDGGIDGSQVGHAWDNGRRGDVAAYCCRDTKALADCVAAYDESMGAREVWA